jgi:hypothetical protein
MSYPSSSELDAYLAPIVTIPAKFMEAGREVTGTLIKFEGVFGNKNMYAVKVKGEPDVSALKILTDVEIAELVNKLKETKPMGGRRSRKRRATRRAKGRTRRSRS